MVKINYHSQALEVIKRWDTLKSGKMIKKSSRFNGVEARMEPINKGFSISFELNHLSKERKKIRVGQQHKKIEFHTSKETIVIESMHLNQYSPPHFRGSIDFFFSKGYSFKKKYYYRLIIPLQKELDFHFQIDKIVFDSDLGFHSSKGTKVWISQDEITINVIQNETKKYFLFIESKKAQTYNSFSDKAFAIKNGLGYLTGYLAGDNGYFFCYTNKKMKDVKHYYFCEFRDTIITGYRPIYTNPYGYLSNKVAEKYYNMNILRPVNLGEFSILCQKLHDSIEFSGIILLILESCKASLLFMPGGFAIALETLSDLIIGNQKEKLAPIKEKKLSKLVRKDCKEVINRHCINLPPEDLNVLIGRIDQINQTTNKARLRAPFDKLKIPLLEQDLAILESRNAFLHGRVPDLIKIEKDTNLNQINRNLYYASMRFYTLLNILILKWIGYDNYVLNHPIIQKHLCIPALKEEPYRKV